MVVKVCPEEDPGPNDRPVENHKRDRNPEVENCVFQFMWVSPYGLASLKIIDLNFDRFWIEYLRILLFEQLPKDSYLASSLRGSDSRKGKSHYSTFNFQLYYFHYIINILM